MKIISLILVLFFLQGCLLNHSKLNEAKMLNNKYFEYLSIYNKREKSLLKQLDQLNSIGNDLEYFNQIWEYKKETKILNGDIKNNFNDFRENFSTFRNRFTNFETTYKNKLNNLIISKIKDIEEKNSKTIKSKKYSNVIVNNFCKDYINIEVLFQIINEYYLDHRKSPHIIFFKTLDDTNQREFLFLINSARNEINMGSIILSFYKSIDENDIKEVKYLYDLLFPMNKILSRFIILKSLKLKEKKIYKYLINKLQNKKKSIHRYCIEDAINTNNIELFKFLSNKTDTHELDFDGKNLLQECIIKKSNLINKYILDNKMIDPLALDDNNNNSFFYAAKVDNIKLFKNMMNLVNYDKNVNHYSKDSEKKIRPVFFLIKNKHHGVIDSMLSKEIIDANSYSCDDTALLHQAIAENNVFLVEMLINKYDADIYLEAKRNMPALHYALDIGANREIINIIRNKKDSLFHLSSKGQTAFVYDISLLDFSTLNIGVNDGINNHEPIIHFLISKSSCKREYQKLLEIFENFHHEIDFDKLNSKNETIFHCMAFVKECIVKKLGDIILKFSDNTEISEKIDLHNMNENNKTAMDVAIEQKNIVLVELLCLLGYDLKKANSYDGMTIFHRILQNANYRRSIIKHQIDIKSKYLLNLILNITNYDDIMFSEDKNLNTPYDVLNQKIISCNLKMTRGLKRYKSLFKLYNKEKLSRLNFNLYRFSRGRFSLKKFEDDLKYDFFEKKLDFIVGLPNRLNILGIFLNACLLIQPLHYFYYLFYHYNTNKNFLFSAHMAFYLSLINLFIQLFGLLFTVFL